MRVFNMGIRRAMRRQCSDRRVAAMSLPLGRPDAIVVGIPDPGRGLADIVGTEDVPVVPARPGYRPARYPTHLRSRPSPGGPRARRALA